MVAKKAIEISLSREYREIKKFRQFPKVACVCMHNVGELDEIEATLPQMKAKATLN